MIDVDCPWFPIHESFPEARSSPGARPKFQGASNARGDGPVCRNTLGYHLEHARVIKGRKLAIRILNTQHVALSGFRIDLKNRILCAHLEHLTPPGLALTEVAYPNESNPHLLPPVHYRFIVVLHDFPCLLVHVVMDLEWSIRTLICPSGVLAPLGRPTVSLEILSDSRVIDVLAVDDFLGIIDGPLRKTAVFIEDGISALSTQLTGQLLPIRRTRDEVSVRIFTTAVTRRDPTTVVMDEDRDVALCDMACAIITAVGLRREDIEVVVVVAGDGEVPHPAVVEGRDRAADHHGRLAVRRLEMHARFEVFCRNPTVVQ